MRTLTSYEVGKVAGGTPLIFAVGALAGAGYGGAHYIGTSIGSGTFSGCRLGVNMASGAVLGLMGGVPAALTTRTVSIGAQMAAGAGWGGGASMAGVGFAGGYASGQMCQGGGSW